MALLTTLAVADDTKLVDWLQQRLGLLEQRDTAMLHRLLHDIEKKYHQIKNALVSIFQLFILTATGNMSLCGLKKECLIAASELVTCRE